MREAVALYRGQGQGGGVNWVKVSSYMGGTRSYQQCRMRWHNVLKVADAGLVKEGAWTENEVTSLSDAIVHVMHCLCLCNVCMNSV